MHEIKSLTGLRGLSATLVMLDHYSAIDFSQPFPMNMLPHMYLAVDMFMMLSGFILAMTYEDRLRHLPAGKGCRLFLVRRVARLYPLYALTTIVCFGLCRTGWLTFLDPDSSVVALVANLLLVQTWLWPGSSLNGPGWSISTEWLANLTFPGLVLVILGTSPTRAAWVAGAGLGIVAVSALAFGQLFDVPSPGAVNTITGPGAVGRCMGEFVIGMYCWRLRSRSPGVRVLGRSELQLGLILLLLLVMQDTRLDLFFVILCALLLIGVSFEISIVSTVLRSAPLAFLGRISYSIYLVHITLLPVRDGLARTLNEIGVPNAWCSAVLCCAVLTLLLATLTRRYVERPAQTLILSWCEERGVNMARAG